MLTAWLDRRQPEWLELLRLGAPLHPGPTARLSLTIQSAWHPRDIFVQIKVQLDEANSHKEADTMTMGGYMGRIGQWNRFDHKWRKSLRKAGLEYFHAQEMPHHPFGVKAQKIADDFLMAGFVVRLDRKDYYEVYRDPPGWGGKIYPDSMYGLCFRFLLSAALEIGQSEYPTDLRLDFIVESGHPNEGAPNEIVQRLKRQKIRGVSEFLGTVTPIDKADSYGLQAADGLATGAAWIEGPAGSEVPLIDISPAGRLADVYPKSKMKAPLFRCHIDRPQLTQYRSELFEFWELRKRFGEQQHAKMQADKAAKVSSEGQPS